MRDPTFGELWAFSPFVLALVVYAMFRLPFDAIRVTAWLLDRITPRPSGEAARDASAGGSDA